MTPTKSENHQSGVCPICGYGVYLDAEGRIRGHLKREEGKYLGTCEGHGQLPAKDNDG